MEELLKRGGLILWPWSMEQQPNETVRRKELGEPKSPFRWEVGASDGKAAGSALLMHPRLPPSCLGADQTQLCTFVLTQFHYGTFTSSFCLVGLFCGADASSRVLTALSHLEAKTGCFCSSRL